MNYHYITLLLCLITSLPLSAEVIDFEGDIDLFNEIVIQSNLPVVLKFFTPRCGHCITMKKAQVFETVSKNPLFQDKVLFIDLDAEKHMEISQAFNLRSVPTILFIQNGQILAEHKGALTVNDLVTKIKTCFGIK